jgi:hypothetical protein
MLVIGTTEGLVLVEKGGEARPDALAGREVTALVRTGESWWAVADGREVWRSSDARDWTAAGEVDGPAATCLAPTPMGLVVGTEGAHLLRLAGDRLVPVTTFDDAEGRAEWYTPWGDPAAVRSISATESGQIYVNVHVGGVVRSTDSGRSWKPMLDIEVDVHQVLAHPAEPDTVLVAAAAGFGVSRDAGTTWQFENTGLHAHYCRAVAVANGTVLLSASSGHHGRRAALYRRPLGESGAFERCREGLPTWFGDNVDTACLAARGATVALGTEDGTVFLSRDEGAHWQTVVKGLAGVRSVVLG